MLTVATVLVLAVAIIGGSIAASSSGPTPTSCDEPST